MMSPILTLTSCSIQNEIKYPEPVVEGISFDGVNLTFSGKNLEHVKEVKIQGSDARFQIQVQTPVELRATLVDAVSLVVGETYNFLVGSANATTSPTQVTIELPQMGAGHGQIMRYNANLKKWVATDFDGLTYLGSWDASSNLPALRDGSSYLADEVPSPGDFYVVSNAGSTSVDGTTTWLSGDWIIFGTNGWERVQNAGGVTSFNGRTGVVVPQANDYELNDMSDVEISATPSDGQVLKYQSGKWVPGADNTGSGGGGGITSLGGQTGSTQTLAVGSSGTAPAWSSAGNAHTLNIPMASGVGVTGGLINRSEYDYFYNKSDSGHSHTAATTGADGFMSAADKTTLNTVSGWGNHASAGYLTSESDPQVGTLTASKWCTTDGTSVNCTTNAPVTSESDPTVTASVKDGVDVSELLNGVGLYLAYKPNNAACSEGQLLSWDSINGRWVCASASGVESDPQVGTLTASKWCTTDGTSVNCTSNAPVTTESDPKVGTLTASKWCTSDGSAVNCATNAPVTSESDPTVTASVKDGVDFSELLNGVGLYMGYKPNNAACSDADLLSWDNTNSRWICSTPATESDPQVGTLTATKWCTTDGTSVNCTSNAPVTSESDPKVGTLTATKWCTSDGSTVSCTSNAPVTTESDPKVGTLTATKWCTSDGSTVSCTSNAPATSMDTAYDGGSSVTVDTTDVTFNLTSTNDFLIQDNGSETFRVTDTGTIGLGVAAPVSARLDVSGNAPGSSASTVARMTSDDTNAGWQTILQVVHTKSDGNGVSGLGGKIEFMLENSSGTIQGDVGVIATQWTTVDTESEIAFSHYAGGTNTPRMLLNGNGMTLWGDLTMDAAGGYFQYKPNAVACAEGETMSWDNTNGRWICSGPTAARAYRNTSTQSIPSLTYTKVQLNAETFDLKSEFDSTTNYRYTATQAGIYRVSAAARILAPAVGDGLEVAIYVNGAIHSSGVNNTASTASSNTSMSDLVQLSANDYVEMYVLHSNGAAKNLDFGSNKTYFAIEKIK